MSVFDANLNYLPCYVWTDMNDEKSNFVGKNTFHPIFFFWEKRDGHSKRGRMEIIDLQAHLKTKIP